MATCDKQLPQVGTDPKGAGESHPPLGGCPSYSGGGNNRLPATGPIREATRKNQKKSKSLKGTDEREDVRNVEVAESVLDLSEAESMDTDGSRASTPGLWKKRKYLDSDSGNDDEPSPKVPTAVRGRGRPPTTGQYVGLAKAKEALNAAKREALELQAEEEIAGLAQRQKSERLARLSDIESGEAEPMTAAEIAKTAMENVDIIESTCKKSKNLKGTSVRAIKDAMNAIREAVAELSSHSISDETRCLRADNARLQAELRELRQEVTQMREEMRKPHGPSGTAPVSLVDLDTEELPAATSSQPMSRASCRSTQPSVAVTMNEEDRERDIMVKVGTMINARFEALEERLLPEKRLRPPLAADGKRKISETCAGASNSVPEPQASKGKKKAKVLSASQPTEHREPQALPPAPTSMSQGWNVVTKKGLKKKTGEVSQSPKTQTKAAKLRPPRSSAVVITLQPEAVEKGMTYGEVINEAKSKMNLGDFGISSIKFRRAATGARILEVSGATSGEKADRLAEKLRESLPKESVWVSRPTKQAELRVSGLDDSTTAAEVAAAVGKIGDCPTDAIKTGEIRSDLNGLGSLWLRCPIKAAKKVAESGRLLVGWVSARVKLLEPRPMCCYRCLETGHVRLQCTSEVDRSSQCYRCGKTGHKAITCVDALHCTICAAANKPAGHKIGSKSCPVSKKKKRMRAGGFTLQPNRLPVSQEEAVPMAMDS